MIKEVNHVGDKMIKRSDQFEIEWFIDNSRLSNYLISNLLDSKINSNWINHNLIRFEFEQFVHL